MTVEELIEKLREVPSTAVVIFEVEAALRDHYEADVEYDGGEVVVTIS